MCFSPRKEDLDVAIKIYRIRTANFNAMNEYILGDRRFTGIKKAKKDLDFCMGEKRILKP